MSMTEEKKDYVIETIMNPNYNPFTPPGKKYPCAVKPIDRALHEIKVLKKEITELRKQLEPFIEERNKRLEEEKREEPVVIDHKSWWFS
jgi:hypothetical protein